MAKIGWMIVLVLSTTVMVRAEAPATQRAGNFGESVDGVAFPPPPVGMTAVPGRQTKMTARQIKSLLLSPPGETGIRIYSTAKSAAMLRSRTGGELDNAWFAVDLAGADAAGFDLAEGVIARIDLFFRNGAAGRKVMEKEFGPSVRGWEIKTIGRAMRASVSAKKGEVYALRHPELDDASREAVKTGKPFVGLSGELLDVVRGQWRSRMVSETTELRMEEWGLGGMADDFAGQIQYVQWTVWISRGAIVKVLHLDEGKIGR